jgi:hypothetical protein
MDCPDCGTPLVTYRLADREAPVCEQCGHVGIEAEHRVKRARIESWADALRRFYDATDPGEDLTIPVAATGRGGRRARAETWAEALRRFYGASDGRDAGDPTGRGGEEPARDDPRTGPAPAAFEGPAAVSRANGELPPVDGEGQADRVVSDDGEERTDGVDPDDGHH